MKTNHKPEHPSAQELSGFDRLLHQVLHLMEKIIAAVTVIALIVTMGREILGLVHMTGTFEELSTFLHHVLTIVVGLEFVRMIVDTSRDAILEVLSVAITRHIVLNHEDPWSNLACIACIAALFAIRRYLMPGEEKSGE